MKENSFEEKVRRVDWNKYLEPEYYDPETMFYDPERLVRALIQISRFENLKDNSSDMDITGNVRNAIGNDHRGTYYPAALEAIDLIIEVQENSDSEAARKCATAILNDLHYFQLELSSSDESLRNEIEIAIKKKLLPFSDENLADYWA